MIAKVMPRSEYYAFQRQLYAAIERADKAEQALREIANGVYTGQEMRKIALHALGAISAT